MIRLSTRYAVPLVLLALLAAVPVYLHASGALDRDDCTHPDLLRATLLIEGSGSRNGEAADNARYLQREVGRLSWEHRDDHPLRFALVRDFDPVDVALQPHSHVTRRFEAAERGLDWREREGERLPVHWLLDRTGRRPRFASYVFVYRARPVASPARALLRSAPARLVGGARPLTLLAVGGEVDERGLAEARAAAEDWLFAAWAHYEEACTP